MYAAARVGVYQHSFSPSGRFRLKGHFSKCNSYISPILSPSSPSGLIAATGHALAKDDLEVGGGGL